MAHKNQIPLRVRARSLSHTLKFVRRTICAFQPLSSIYFPERESESYLLLAPTWRRHVMRKIAIARAHWQIFQYWQYHAFRQRCLLLSPRIKARLAGSHRPRSIPSIFRSRRRATRLLRSLPLVSASWTFAIRSEPDVGLAAGANPKTMRLPCR